ncbi:hypothetical protein ACFLSJ_06665 [Verrucomicrobiota bacterium]
MKRTTKKDKIGWLRERIARDPAFAAECLLAVSRADDGMRTGLGFRNCDGILRSFAAQHRLKGWLSEKQTEILQRRMQRYARQLAERIIPAERVEREMASDAGAAQSAPAAKVESDDDLSGWRGLLL